MAEKMDEFAADLLPIQESGGETTTGAQLSEIKVEKTKAWGYNVVMLKIEAWRK